MNIILALVVGYVAGAKTRGKDLDRLGRSLKALCETEEFSDVVSAARAQAGSSLRDLAEIVDGGRHQPDLGRDPGTDGDLVARVKSLVGAD